MGPPTYPATFTRHDLAPGSRVEYYMTGPEGDQPHGYTPPRYWQALIADLTPDQIQATKTLLAKA